MGEDDAADTLYSTLKTGPLKLRLKSESSFLSSAPNSINFGVNCESRCGEERLGLDPSKIVNNSSRNEEEFKLMINTLKEFNKIVNSVLNRYESDITNNLKIKGGSKTRKTKRQTKRKTKRKTKGKKSKSRKSKRVKRKTRKHQ